jgi:hypothetical protein
MRERLAQPMNPEIPAYFAIREQFPRPGVPADLRLALAEFRGSFL